MYRTFECDGKEYRLEYSIEAYLAKAPNAEGRYASFIAPLVGMVAGESGGEDLVAAMDIPTIAVYSLYAGLLRWHGRGSHGDKTILSVEDAGELAIALIDGHPDDEELGSFAGLMNMCLAQMEEDGFFKRLAASQIPKDHKKKQSPKA